jgi:hypothetical protein
MISLCSLAIKRITNCGCAETKRAYGESERDELVAGDGQDRKANENRKLEKSRILIAGDLRAKHRPTTRFFLFVPFLGKEFL